MQQFVINAEPRNDVGKGASRRLRKTGKIPGIVYGSNKDATSISVGHDELVHQLDQEAFYSHILTLNLSGKSESVVLKDLQRHPYKPRLLHIDFQRVLASEKLTMRVPLHFTNETTCVGVKTGGGIISHILNDIEVTCLPGNLPEFIEVDMAAVNIGESIHLGDIKLPENVENTALLHGGDADQPVVSVHIQRVSAEDEAEEAEEAIVAPGEVPAAADSKDDED
jgi:large subunit ribosomal protein L25